MEGFFFLRFREESINEGVEWKVCVVGGGCVCMHVRVCVCARWIEEVGDCVCGEGGVRRVSCVCGGCVVANVHALHMPFRRALTRVCSPLPRSYGNVFINRCSSPNTLVFPPTCRYLFFAPPPHLSLFCLIPLAASVEKQLCALIIGVYIFTDIPHFAV